MSKLSKILLDISNEKKDVELVAVSKYMTLTRIKELYDEGQRVFGENKVQDLKLKKEFFLDLDIKWHFIGNLQKNKINHLVSCKPVLWQSCASLEMAIEVDKRLDYKLDTLLEINSSMEASKGGIKPEEAIKCYESILSTCKNINLVGVMSIGALSNDTDEIKASFDRTYEIFTRLSTYGAKICSMGMSGDFKLAIECGSNMVRIGSALD